MTGWQRLRIVLSVIYWGVAITLATGVYFTVRESQRSASPPPASAPSQAKTPAGKVETDAEIWGANATASANSPEPTQQELQAEFCRQQRGNCAATTATGANALVFVGVILGGAAVLYAIAASLWWAFAGFGHQRGRD